MTAAVVAALWGAAAGTWLRAGIRSRPVDRAPAPAPSLPRRVRGLGSVGPPLRTLLGALAVGLSVAVLLHPVLGLVPPVGALVRPWLRARRQARRATAGVVEQLPDVVDLLRLTALAGFPVSAAIVAIGDRPGGLVGLAFHRAAHRLARGADTVRALSALIDVCGPPVQPLVDALVDHDRYGTPLVPALDRVGIECRLRRRRQAEEEARRLPVTLLFPLVFTTLPACALLTVVPLLVASLTSLQP